MRNCSHISVLSMQFAEELKQCEQLLGLIVANIDPAQVCRYTETCMGCGAAYIV